LELRGPRLEVVHRSGRVLAAIDTRTHRLVRPDAPDQSGAGTSWLPIALAGAAVAAFAALVRRRRPAARTA
jgi:MYXO-CTERM domain-containing protein